MLNFNIQIKNYFQNPILFSNQKGAPTVIAKEKKVFLFFEENNAIYLATSKDGINFKKYNKNPLIEESGARCANPKITKIKRNYFLIYEAKKKNSSKTYLYVALSKNLFKWEKMGEISPRKKLSIIQDYKYNGKICGYFIGRDSIKIAFSKNLKKWQVKVKKEPIFFTEKNENIKTGPSPIVAEQGILFFYNTVNSAKKGTKYYSWNLILFDKENPGKILWRTKEPIFSSENNKITLGGLVKFQGRWLLYYYSEIDKGINIAFLDFWEDIKEEESSKLIKFEGNPILDPRKIYFWEDKACFNAAAIYEQNKVYIVYRSITKDDVSVLGLAVSNDGINISERLTEPIYVPREPFEINPSGKRTYYIGFSGSGHSGCEDPRIVKIEDRFYMTYVAFDGCNPPRIALTSIKESDFLNYQWNWEKPILISPPGIGDKQACIFPEKIIGNYIFLHRIFPDIWMDFVPDLKFEDRWLAGNIFARPRESKWDSLKIGAAASPIKTEKGWLLIYNGVSKKDYKYKIGAMLLDLKDPSRVLARSNQPILEPDNEKEGNIVYSCGSVIIKDRLYVYYGQNDYSLGVATANLGEFLQKLS